MQVVELVSTCLACPSQWEGKTDDDREVYIHYRWGQLTIRVGKIGVKHSEKSDLDGMDIIFQGQIGDLLDGVLEYKELKGFLETRLHGTKLHLKLPNTIKEIEF